MGNLNITLLGPLSQPYSLKVKLITMTWWKGTPFT